MVSKSLSSHDSVGPLDPTGRAGRWWTLVVLCISLLVISLDNTILNVALPSIIRDLHASSSDLQWVVDSYVVVFAGLLLVLGSLGDRIGRKWTFMAGLLVFGAGSAASAFSGTPGHLVAARAFMGIGAAAVMPSTLSILTNVFIEPNERARAIGIWSGTMGIGVAIGPVAGGWLLAHYWWGSVFLVNVPIALVGMLAAAMLVPNSKSSHSDAPDVLGGLLSTSGMGAMLWGIIDAPTRGWGSGWVLVSIFAGVSLLVLFAVWERYSAHPMLDVDLFRNRRFSVAMGSMGMLMFALMGGLFLLTQYLQFSLGFSPLQTGLRIAPIAAVILVAAPISNLVVRRVGTKVVVASGLALIAVGLAILSGVTVFGTYLDVLPSFFLIGIGTGIAFAPSTESVMGALPLERAGVGSATNGAALQIGGGLGVGVLGSILNTRYMGRLSPSLSGYQIPRTVASTIEGSLGGALAVAQRVGGSLGADLGQLAKVSFVSGMDLAITVGSVVVGAAAVTVVAMLPSKAASESAEEAD